MGSDTRLSKALALKWMRCLLAPLATAIVLVTFVSACGFQLRSAVAIPYRTMMVDAGAYPGLADELERAIRVSRQTTVVSTLAEAEAVLKIVSESREKNILALSAGGRVREFELRYRVTFQLTDPAGANLIASSEIVLRRDMSFDDTQVLAKESEEALLFKDMRTDAVRQMLRRLSSAKRLV